MIPTALESCGAAKRQEYYDAINQTNAAIEECRIVLLEYEASSIGFWATIYSVAGAIASAAILFFYALPMSYVCTPIFGAIGVVTIILSIDAFRFASKMFKINVTQAFAPTKFPTVTPRDLFRSQFKHENPQSKLLAQFVSDAYQETFLLKHIMKCFKNPQLR